ncbi:MAG: response regulator [Elusimicrobiota bacterium]
MNEKKILIIDDTPEIIKYFSFILEREGYEITGITKATNVMAELERNAYPVILLDIKMPGIDGVELLEEIKEKHPDSQVIMNTAYSSIDSAIKTLEHGAFAYLTKPVKKEELITAVKQAIDNYCSQTQNKILMDELKEKNRDGKLVYILLVMNYDSGIITNINMATERYLGYEKGGLVNNTVDTVMEDGFWKAFLEEIFKQNKLNNFRIELIDKDKNMKRLLFNGSVLKDKNKNIAGIVGVARENMDE